MVLFIPLLLFFLQTPVSVLTQKAQAVQSAAPEKNSVQTSTRTKAQTYNEVDLMELIDESPQLKKINSQIERLQAEINGTMVNFGPALESSIKYNNTDETPLIVFQPPNQPYYSAEIKLNHYTQYGVGYSLGVLGESLTSGPQGADALANPGVFSINSARVNPKASITFDLLKNRFGSETLNQVKSLQAQMRSLELQKEITREDLVVQLRKLYWNYNILIEKKELNEEILTLTIKLLRNIERKQKDGFVEKGDLYSAQSQKSGQKANISLLKYQIEQIKKNMLTLLPGLPLGFEIETAKISGNEKFFDVCLKTILNREDVPLDWSYYTEQMRENQTALNFTKDSLESFSQPELKLFGEISGTQVDTRLRDAAGDYLDRADYGYTLGLTFNMPLSSSLKKQRDNLMNSEEFRVKSENQIQRLELKALHEETKNTIILLNEALEDQKETSSSLKKSYEFKQKQYNQARVDLLDVLQEQNNYLSSQVNQLDISKIVVDALLGYKAKFQKFSCEGAVL